MRNALALAVAVATAGSALAGNCDDDSQCTYTVNFNGKDYSYDLRGLCNTQDYTGVDDKGHAYSMNICGTTTAKCLPSDFSTQYDVGSAVQYWGSAPVCDLTNPAASCVDKETQKDTCCTASCQVIALQETLSQPVAQLIDSGDISKGISLVLHGETPTLDDPNACSNYDPVTGQPVLRRTRYNFTCDASVRGFAQVLSVAQDENDDCLYTVVFATNLACVGGNPLTRLSGGWVFNIIFFTVAGLYLAVGSGLHYARHRELALPNAGLWEEFNSLVTDGLLFVLSGFRRSARGGGGRGFAMMGKGAGAAGLNSAEPTPLFAGSSSGSSDGAKGAVAFGEL